MRKKRQRKQYSADLKAKIAVEAIKGQRTIQEIASHYEVHPNQVTQWKAGVGGRGGRILEWPRPGGGTSADRLKARQ